MKMFVGLSKKEPSFHIFSSSIVEFFIVCQKMQSTAVASDIA
jgi:hypothetical protein